MYFVKMSSSWRTVGLYPIQVVSLKGEKWQTSEGTALAEREAVQLQAKESQGLTTANTQKLRRSKKGFFSYKCQRNYGLDNSLILDP